jgi:hypothetical protein
MATSKKDFQWAMLSHGVTFLRQNPAIEIKRFWRDSVLDSMGVDELRVMLCELKRRQTPIEDAELVTIENNEVGLCVFLAWITEDWILAADKDSLIEKLTYQPAQAMQCLDLWLPTIKLAIQLGIVKENCMTPTAAAGVRKAVYA